MAREMTDKEKLDFIGKAIDALNRGGFFAFCECVELEKQRRELGGVVNEFDGTLPADYIDSPNDISMEKVVEMTTPREEYIGPQVASIYAPEHEADALAERDRSLALTGVQDNGPGMQTGEDREVRGPVLERVLTPNPNPYSDSRVVRPGENL